MFSSAFDQAEADWWQQEDDDPWAGDVVVPNFIAQKKYEGPKAHMVYKTGALGLGYYHDVGPRRRPPAKKPAAFMV